MPMHRVTATARIDAPPTRVYAVLADYRGHPRMLPERCSDLRIERGGVGTGTIVRVRLKLAGRTVTRRAAITEPEPGRVLVETGLEGRMAVTTFTVTPADGGCASDVTISTELRVAAGVAGLLQRFLATRLLHPIWVRRLELLSACVCSGAVE